jgi:hypothetical protein
MGHEEAVRYNKQYVYLKSINSKDARLLESVGTA